MLIFDPRINFEPLTASRKCRHIGGSGAAYAALKIRLGILDRMLRSRPPPTDEFFPRANRAEFKLNKKIQKKILNLGHNLVQISEKEGGYINSMFSEVPL